MSKSLPLVHLSLLRPILSGLRDRGIDPQQVLDAAGLTEEAIRRDDTTVHVMVIHQFLELAADTVGDQGFCASIGEGFDPDGWPMIARALEEACSLAEFLSIYVTGANSVASSVVAYLNVRGAHAIFGESRLFRPTIPPAQNDGFMIGLSLSILRRALGDRLEPSEVSLVVCDPTALPQHMKEFQALRGDNMGFRIQFPSEWLAYSVGKHAKMDVPLRALPDRLNPDFLTGFRMLLAQSISQGGVTAESATTLVSMSRSKLARTLRAQGTTITKEIDEAKRSFAVNALASNATTIEEIAAQLGYTDPSNFARWFKRMSGEAPSVFRRRCKEDIKQPDLA
ncbi:MAG: helix-turn-helix domain-containing protein [Pseudomonadota bacterium]